MAPGSMRATAPAAGRTVNPARSSSRVPIERRSSRGAGRPDRARRPSPGPRGSPGVRATSSRDQRGAKAMAPVGRRDAEARERPGRIAVRRAGTATAAPTIASPLTAATTVAPAGERRPEYREAVGGIGRRQSSAGASHSRSAISASSGRMRASGPGSSGGGPVAEPARRPSGVHQPRSLATHEPGRDDERLDERPPRRRLPFRRHPAPDRDRGRRSARRRSRSGAAPGRSGPRRLPSARASASGVSGGGSRWAPASHTSDQARGTTR